MNKMLTFIRDHPAGATKKKLEQGLTYFCIALCVIFATVLAYTGWYYPPPEPVGYFAIVFFGGLFSGIAYVYLFALVEQFIRHEFSKSK